MTTTRRRFAAPAALLLAAALSVLASAAGPREDESRPAAKQSAATRADQPDARRYEDAARRFHLTVPKGWTALGHQYSVMHYRDVFLCISSAGNKALRVTNKREGDTESYSAETVAEQLAPGTVYIDVAHFDGPATSYAGKPDTVGEDLTAALKGLKPRKTAGGKLSEIRFAFIKNGHRWSVFVFCREPVEDALRNQALDVLRSLRFEGEQK